MTRAPIRRPGLPAIRRCAVLLLCAAAPACAPAGSPTAPPPAGLGRFDGVYRGMAVAKGSGPECGAASTPVRITVVSGHAWVGPRHRRHRMDGRVTEDGQVALADDTGSHQLRGSIAGNQLTAVEELPRDLSLGRQQPGMPTTCSAVVTATRTADAP